MSSRIRNSESQRGMKGETLPQADTRERHPRPGKSHSSFRGVNPSKWSGVEANNALKSDDCSAWPSWESPPPDNNVKRDDDPAFDGRGRQHHSRPSNDSWSQPQRVRGSVRNRSRERDSSRSRSRSRSRGRGKVRGRSRSRSRSWDRGEGGGRGRSRSPLHDGRHESYDNIDKGSGPRLSSRVCRDFALGKCRRGSNCRFLHQENLNSQGGRHSDNDVTERSGSRPEYGGASRYVDNRDSVDHTHDKVSDGSRRYSGKDEPDSTERSSSRPDYGGSSRYGDNRSSADRPRDDGARRYNVEDESVRDNIKDTFCCKEFQKGRCRFGASCRYPHHAVSEDNHNRGNRNASYNHDGKGPPSRSGKVPCKYFLSGNCHREDCRFSHDAPMSEGVDGRSRDDRLGNIADEKTKSWNGPTWDEVTPGLTNTTKSTGRRDSSFHNLNPHDSASYEKHADVKNNSWNGPTWDEVNEPDLSDTAKFTRQPDTSVRNLNSYDSEAYDKHMDENKPWSGMTWDETSAPGLSDATKSVEWGERSVGNIKPHDSVAIGKHSGARGGHGWENNSRPMDGPVWNEKTVERNEYISPGASMDAYMGTNEYRSMKKLDGNEEGQLVFDRSRSQTLDGISMPSHERNIMLDTSVRELATTVMQAHAPEISYRYGRDNPASFDDSNVLDVDMVSEDTTYPVLTPKKVFSQSGHSMGYQSPSNLGGIEQSRPTISLNTLNRPNIDFSGSVHDIYPPLTQPMQTRLDRNEAGEAQGLLEQGVRQVMPEMSETVVSSEQVAQITDLPAILNQISQNGKLPQIIAALNPNNGMGLVHSVPSSASVVPPVPMFVPPSMDMKLKEQYDPARESMAIKRHGSNNEPSGVFSTSIGKENDVPGEEHQKSPKSKQQGPGVSEEVKNLEEKSKQEQEKNQAGGSDARGNVEEGSISNDEKAMRLFKIALVDFVKEILKPTWKEGGMSREVHKAVVKKVVDKVTSTVQGIQIPRTPEKIEQYLAFSKSKISKLVTAYVERLSKPADA